MDTQVDRIIHLIFAIKQVSHEQLAKKCCNFSFFQFATLRYIKEKKPLMKDLADFLAVTPPSATSFIDTLVKAGLVKRVQDSKDRRIVQIVTTKKGDDHLKKGSQAVIQGMRKILENLNKKEQENLSNILIKILEVKKSK